MKKTFIVSLFFVFVFTVFNNTAFAATTPTIVYKAKSALLDISCVGKKCVSVGNNLVVQSVDKGVTWKTVFSKKIGSNNGGSSLEDVDCIGTLCIASGQGGKILRSSDSGKNWAIIDTILSKAHKDFFPSFISGVNCIDEKLCYAIGGNFHSGGDIKKFDKAFGTVILKTTDGGITWNTEKFEKATFNYPAPNLSQTSQSDVFELKYKSTDEFPLRLMKKILCKNKTECFAIGQSRSVFHTTDGWKTVTLQQFKVDETKTFDDNGNLIKPKNPQKVAIYDFSGISFTKDGGVIVEEIGNGHRFVYKSTDNGATWKSISVPLSASSRNNEGKIACSQATCVITAQNLPANKVDILTSVDNGDTWKYQTFKKSMGIYGSACIDSNNCFAVGDLNPQGVVLKVR